MCDVCRKLVWPVVRGHRAPSAEPSCPPVQTTTRATETPTVNAPMTVRTTAHHGPVERFLLVHVQCSQGGIYIHGHLAQLVNAEWLGGGADVYAGADFGCGLSRD